MGVKKVNSGQHPFLVDVSFMYPSGHDKEKYVRVNKTFEVTSRLHASKVFNVLAEKARQMPFPYDEIAGNGTELADTHKVCDGIISEGQKRHFTEFTECPRAYVQPMRIGKSFLQEAMREYDFRVKHDISGDFKLEIDNDRIDSLREGLRNQQLRIYGEAVHHAMNGTVPVNPFMLGERTEGENKGRLRKKIIPEVQNKFWMIVNCDVTVKGKLVEITWPAKKCFDNRMDADKAAVHMAEKHPGIRFAVMESVKDARVEMVTRKEVVTKDIVEPKLTINRL